jgi:hypothetical protein
MEQFDWSVIGPDLDKRIRDIVNLSGDPSNGGLAHRQ